MVASVAAAVDLYAQLRAELIKRQRDLESNAYRVPALDLTQYHHRLGQHQLLTELIEFAENLVKEPEDDDR